ncbi:SPAG8 protein, partial [Rhynochetos jubatus]|nr:SPAG8 protein [Rhynochetos jubatus]
PAEQPSWMVPRGSCLIHNWQEERATNHLDRVPGQEPGSEAFTYRHGHQGLLVHQLPSQPANSTTTKDTYRPPHRALLLGRGEAEPPPTGAVCPPKGSQGFLAARLMAPSPPQGSDRPPCSLPVRPLPPAPCAPGTWGSQLLTGTSPLQGVTRNCSGDSPFRRNAAFSTPITEYLEQPLP